MTDRRNERLASDQRLREAEMRYRSSVLRAVNTDEAAPVGKRRPADKSGAASSRPGGSERQVRAGVRLVPEGELWARLTREQYGLIVDGQQIGRVLTSMGRDTAGFGGVARLRRTMVVLPDGVTWRIDANPPGPKRTVTIRGKARNLSHSIEERVVAVDDRTFRLASTDGPLGKKRGAQAIATAANRTYEISPVRKARRGTTGRFATIEREGVAWYRPWRISTSTDLPLSVALLHWHLLMGDWRPESQATGGG